MYMNCTHGLSKVFGTRAWWVVMMAGGGGGSGGGCGGTDCYRIISWQLSELDNDGENHSVLATLMGFPVQIHQLRIAWDSLTYASFAALARCFNSGQLPCRWVPELCKPHVAD